MRSVGGTQSVVFGQAVFLASTACSPLKSNTFFLQSIVALVCGRLYGNICGDWCEGFLSSVSAMEAIQTD